MSEPQRQSPPSQRKLALLIVPIIIVAALAGVGGYLWRLAQPQEVKKPIEGTVLAIDVGARTAAIEFVHPKSGELMKIEGEIAEDCRLHAHGSDVALADMHAGDKVKVAGKLYKFPAVRMVATDVELVQRRVVPTTQPSDPAS